MPAYKFEALTAEGKTTTGLLEADNAKAARAQLRAQSLVPMEVSQVAASGREAAGAFNTSRRVFSATNLAVNQTLPTYVLTFTGVPSGATAPTLSGTTTSSSANAGSYSNLSLTSLTLSDPNTYQIGTLTGIIVPRPVSSIGASVSNKVYDATTTGSGSLTGYTAGSGLNGTGSVVTSGNSTTVNGNGVISGTIEPRIWCGVLRKRIVLLSQW